MSTFNLAFDRLIGEEGGYVNDPDDAGGETKFGISKRAYPHVDIKHLTVKQAKAIYYDEYWLPSLATKCDSRLSNFIFDTAVNMGMSASNKFVQQALMLTPDGFVGPVTDKAIIAQSFGKMEDDICMGHLQSMVTNRIAFYADLVDRRPQNRRFFFGWVRRTLRLLYEH